MLVLCSRIGQHVVFLSRADFQLCFWCNASVDSYGCPSVGRTLLRASLHEPGLDTDPGQFSVEYYVYMSPGWARVGSFSADPGQFPFRWVERAGQSICVNVISHLGTGCAWARTLNRKKSDVQTIPGQIPG